MANRSTRLNRLTDRLFQLPEEQLAAVERLIDTFAVGSPHAGLKENESGDKSPHSKDGPHAPLHRLDGRGVYIVIAGTLYKEYYFDDRIALNMLE